MSELPDAHHIQVKSDGPLPGSIEEADAALDADLDRIEKRLRIDRPELFDEAGDLREDVAHQLLMENAAHRKAEAERALAALTRHQDARSVDAP
jgi:hypothetical protein